MKYPFPIETHRHDNLIMDTCLPVRQAPFEVKKNSN